MFKTNLDFFFLRKTGASMNFKIDFLSLPISLESWTNMSVIQIIAYTTDTAKSQTGIYDMNTGQNGY
jgi:hypothetical protein